MPFHNYKQFIDFCNHSSIEDKAKLAEFYMHNLVLSNLNIWDGNSRLGDMKLMALASWMTNEEAREKEVKKVMKREGKEPLKIRAELFSLEGS